MNEQTKMNAVDMKNSIFTIIFLFFAPLVVAQSQDEIRLLVRGDDIGSFTSANNATVDSVKQGIVRSLELMVPCSWFPEAVALLNENPTIDVGVHLVLTSEWTNYKWRPLTHAPSFTDEYGYFYPYIWTKGDEPKRSLQEAQWKLSEIEAEFRAQIEMAKKCVPHVTHISDHMGCASWNPEVKAMVNRLAEEYNLFSQNLPTRPFPRMNADRNDSVEKRITAFIAALDQLDPGNTYLFVEHPAYDTTEMRSVGHPGYENVAQDRDGVTKMFTDKRVVDFIKQKNIKLVSYADLIAEAKKPNQWESLFNGRDLSGWHIVCQPQDADKSFWKVEGGTILCDSIGRKDHNYVWLMTDKEFQDFELRLKFQAYSDSPGNSGLQFRSRYDKTDNNGWLNGAQVDIHPPKPMSWRTGLIYDETRGMQRWVFPSLKDWVMPNEYEPKEYVMKYAEDGWNEMTVICKGMQIKTIVNGVVRVDGNATGILDSELHRKHNIDKKGHLALQLHIGDELRIKFKDIVIREIRE